MIIVQLIIFGISFGLFCALLFSCGKEETPKDYIKLALSIIGFILVFAPMHITAHPISWNTVYDKNIPITASLRVVGTNHTITTDKAVTRKEITRLLKSDDLVTSLEDTIYGEDFSTGPSKSTVSVTLKNARGDATRNAVLYKKDIIERPTTGSNANGDTGHIVKVDYSTENKTYTWFGFDSITTKEPRVRITVTYDKSTQLAPDTLFKDQ